MQYANAPAHAQDMRRGGGPRQGTAALEAGTIRDGGRGRRSTNVRGPGSKPCPVRVGSPPPSSPSG
ncbi:hypothetical protein AKJ09_02772 [Labilithrix luteola]|uniref:Uncharacterized protein n=1 Tax=Labilithrix luteola TaxID=1391654 RepID=A0A0K1PRE7_9BACT|nr:hypothetical protein AKJ09_02772 [Labilithrix luteola]